MKVGGEGGIRTHVPLRTRRFRGAPVTTTSLLTPLGAKLLAARSRSPSATPLRRSLAARLANARRASDDGGLKGKQRSEGGGGEGGIRTHVPLRTRRFRGAPVTTTSVPLRYLLRSVGPLDIPHLAARSGCRFAALPSGPRLPTRFAREWGNKTAALSPLFKKRMDQSAALFFEHSPDGDHPMVQ